MKGFVIFILIAAHCCLVIYAVKLAASASPTGASGFRRAQSRGLRFGPWHRTVASWYGPRFFYRIRKDGTPYDPDEAFVASDMLPMGTMIDATNPWTNRSVRVKVRDLGPFVDGRHFDFSSRAADELGMKGPGVVPIIYRVVQ